MNIAAILGGLFGTTGAMGLFRASCWGGFFHTLQGGVVAAIASLIGHAVYGIVLGVVAGGPLRNVMAAG